MNERTEQPTPHRLKKARKEGQLPRSRILTAAVPTLAGAWALTVFGECLVSRCQAFARKALSAEGSPAELTADGLVLLAWAALPIGAVALSAAVAVGVVQAGLQLEWGPLAPKPERIDPLQGLRRLFSAQALGQQARPALLAAAVVSLAALALPGLWRGCAQLPGRDALTAAHTARSALGAPLRMLGAAVALAALGDFLLARWLHLRGLRMSRDDVKQEHKRHEGDANHKAKRKAFHRQLAASGPARGVARATAVVVNPTHIAVALRYAPEECDAPYIVARGREDDAAAIREAARRLGLPVVRDVPLARALVNFDVGEEVPEELFRAAAAVLHVALGGSTFPLAVQRRSR